MSEIICGLNEYCQILLLFHERAKHLNSDYHNFGKELFNIKKAIFLKSYMLKKVPKNYSKDLVFHISP